MLPLPLLAALLWAVVLAWVGALVPNPLAVADQRLVVALPHAASAWQAGVRPPGPHVRAWNGEGIRDQMVRATTFQAFGWAPVGSPLLLAAGTIVAILVAFMGRALSLFSEGTRCRSSKLRMPAEMVAMGMGENEVLSEQARKPPPPRFVAQPFAYHEEVELRIDNLTNLGLGVGRLQGWVVFVPFSLPGELVRARVYRNHKKYSEADLVEVLEPSPDRVQPGCGVYGVCAGCQYQHLRYEKQLEWKRSQVVELLERMADITDVVVAPTLPSPQQYGYRAKITPHFPPPPPQGKGPREVGFLQVGTRSRLVDVQQCPIATPEINLKFQEMRGTVENDRTRYKKAGTLLLRHASADTVTADPCEVCETQVGDLVFQYPARDFFQNNPFVLPAFVDLVKQQAVSLGATFLVDAYCGCGLFALACADAFEAVAGVEVTESSVHWANHNAERNAVPNVTFHIGSAESIFAKVDFLPDRTALVIDPPRKGCSEAFLSQVMRFGPRGLVYVSCNPATQMRDLVLLRAGGYRVTQVQPVDLFPQTRHVECVVTCLRIAQPNPPAQ